MRVFLLVLSTFLRIKLNHIKHIFIYTYHLFSICFWIRCAVNYYYFCGNKFPISISHQNRFAIFQSIWKSINWTVELQFSIVLCISYYIDQAQVCNNIFQISLNDVISEITIICLVQQIKSLCWTKHVDCKRNASTQFCSIDKSSLIYYWSISTERRHTYTYTHTTQLDRNGTLICGVVIEKKAKKKNLNTPYFRFERKKLTVWKSRYQLDPFPLHQSHQFGQ